MLSDSISLGVALVAVRLAQLPPTANRSFGLRRVEVLGALFNGVTLVAIAIWIFIEAIGRLEDPPEVLGGGMLAVALGGVLVNLLAAAVLHRAGATGLNMRAALRHVIADLLGSLGAVIAAVIILASGWLEADPLIGILIGLLILASSWGVLRDSVAVLLEASPRGLDAREVGEAMVSVAGVEEVHDLHVWEVTSGFPALAAHLLVGRADDCHAVRREVESMLHERFGLGHTTLQVDHSGGQLLQIEGTERPSPEGSGPAPAH
jgi:cobalt-zinc-cadmium efflux system protein